MPQSPPRNKQQAARDIIGALKRIGHLIHDDQEDEFEHEYTDAIRPAIEFLEKEPLQDETDLHVAVCDLISTHARDIGMNAEDMRDFMAALVDEAHGNAWGLAEEGDED